jgi:hypothetical protein
MANRISLQSVIAVTPDQVSCDLDGEKAILNLKSGIYFGLNPVGATIWDLIAHPVSVGAVHQALLARYEVDADCCERDLLALLDEMNAKGLIRIIEEGV